MGIRVDEKGHGQPAGTAAGADDRRNMEFHRMILERRASVYHRRGNRTEQALHVLPEKSPYRRGAGIRMAGGDDRDSAGKTTYSCCRSMKYVNLVINNRSDSTDAIYTYACRGRHGRRPGARSLCPLPEGNRLREAYVASLADRTRPIKIKEKTQVRSGDRRGDISDRTRW